MPSPEDAALLGGFGEGIEARRVESERKWGCGRLERLTATGNPELLAKFRRQQATWDQAYEQAWTAAFVSRDLLQAVIDKAGAMQRAFVALDAWAEEAGHRPITPWVWEVLLNDGTVVALCEDDASASKVIADGRMLAVYTAKEIANVIEAIPEALKLAKATWTGAKFKAPDLKRSDGGWVEAGDPIPFGDPPEAPEPELPFAPPPPGGPPQTAAPQTVSGQLSARWEDDLA